MANYVIGDVQGCYQALLRLLDKFNYDSGNDRLWFVGDLVNRGPDSLAVMRFVSQLAIKPIITLGNHDLHYLAQAYGVLSNPGEARVGHQAVQSLKPELECDNLQALIAAPDGKELRDWLRQQKMIHYDEGLGVVMVHAGIAPMWTLNQAIEHAREVEQALHGEQFMDLLEAMYGNEPCLWDDSLSDWLRLRVSINYLTRMRFCRVDGSLDLSYKGTIEQAFEGLIPWFKLSNRKKISPDILFGHWAALQGRTDTPGVYALDTGCLWGGVLTALRLEDREFFHSA